MAQAVAHCGQLFDEPVQLIRLVRENSPVDPGPAILSEHRRHFVERESGRAPDPDQRQPLEHGRFEDAAQAAPADRQR